MGSVPDLSVEIAGVVFPNPVILASGTVGYGEELQGLLDLGRVGGISVKGTSLEPIEGHHPPRLFPTPSGMLNAVGLQNVGVESFIRDKMPFLRRAGCPVLVNVFGFTIEEYVGVVTRLNACEGIAAYELNISCPNTERGGMVFGNDAAAAKELVARVKAHARRPIIVKLSPNVTDIASIAVSVEAAGADALTVANTYLGMAIDPESFRPRIRNLTGGLSGPAIRPITLRMVYECFRAVRIPIFGLGGIATGEDAIEYFLAGASAVQIGTAHFEDPQVSVGVLKYLERFLKRKGMPSVTAIVGRMESS